MKALIALSMAAVCALCAPPAYAAARTEAKDSDGNGKYDKWMTYDARGQVIVIADDNGRGDGKPHHWRYYDEGVVAKREWDRNFDGRPDLRIFEYKGKMTRKESDDNFDGHFTRSF